MIYINNTEKDVKVRITVSENKMTGMKRYIWKKVKIGQEIDIPESYGKNKHFTPVKEVEKKIETVEGESGKEVVETKVLKKGIFKKKKVI